MTSAWSADTGQEFPRAGDSQGISCGKTDQRGFRGSRKNPSDLFLPYPRLSAQVRVIKSSCTPLRCTRINCKSLDADQRGFRAWSIRQVVPVLYGFCFIRVIRVNPRQKTLARLRR
jgi:hypothetical protein